MGRGCFRCPIPKAERATEKITKEGGKRGRHIVLKQRNVGKIGNLGRMTGWVHRAALVKSGREYNLTNGVGCTLPYSQKRRRKGGRGGERESIIIEVDNIVVCAGQDPKNDPEITLRGGRREGEGGETSRQR